MTFLLEALNKPLIPDPDISQVRSLSGQTRVSLRCLIEIVILDCDFIMLFRSRIVKVQSSVVIIVEAAKVEVAKVIYCWSCGKQSPADAQFCTKCGKPLDKSVLAEH